MISLLLKFLESFDYKFCWLIDANCLNMKLKSILDFTKINNILEFLRSNTLSAGCASSGISNNCSLFPVSNIFNVIYTNWANSLKFLSIFIKNLLFELDIRDEPIVSC